MTTNTQFAAAVAAAIDAFDGVDVAALTTALTTAVTNWDGALPSLAIKTIAEHAALTNLREEEVTNWYGGSVTGGFDADGTPSTGVAPHGGYYPITVPGPGGTPVYRACPAKILSDTMKGDDAKVDVVFAAQFGLAPNEKLPIFRAASAMNFVAANCRGQADGAPTGSAVFTFKKQVNGAGAEVAWGTATFAPGASQPTFSIPSPTLAAGDVLRCYAPAPSDATLADICLTLAGNT